jgi:hypothetical protein
MSSVLMINTACELYLQVSSSQHKRILITCQASVRVLQPILQNGDSNTLFAILMKPPFHSIVMKSGKSDKSRYGKCELCQKRRQTRVSNRFVTNRSVEPFAKVLKEFHFFLFFPVRFFISILFFFVVMRLQMLQ